MIQIHLASLAPPFPSFLPSFLDKLKHNRGRRRRRRSPPMAMDDHDRDDTPHTGLSLTLSYDGRSDLSIGSRPHSSSGLELQRSSSTAKALEPSLTLALPGDVCASVEVEMGRDIGSRHSPPPQSHHPCKIKREDDVRSEEVEKVSSRISDEEEEDSGARKKLRLTKEQSSLLEDKFKEHSSLNPKQKQALAKQLNLRPRQVEVWFQNRRARTKLKKTEVELEFLRRCCETLTEEKRRLQKELQDLEKSHKLSATRHMQIPAMCPSCKKFIGGAETGSPLPASRPRFFNPFAHHAA
ncbi:homeobox-leucine zipper protein HAT22 [Musa acuminata AAA Group]|uniref:homeobox-leucine zipper protein HAT22 n=1 Tax=Musa acuminata AAA Group TaxID=214697 RepID=UPI0031CE843A